MSYLDIAASLGNDAIIAIDRQHGIIESNSAVEAIFGWPGEYLSGRDVTEIIAAPAVREQTRAKLENTLSTGSVERWQADVSTQDGQPLVVHCTAARYLDRGKEPSGAFANTPSGVVILVRDLTMYAHLRREALDAQNELSAFVYRVSHDLREPLRMITSFSELLSEEYGDEFDEDAREYIHFITDGAMRLKNRLAGLLAYSRASPRGRPPEPVDCSAVFDEAVAELKSVIDRKGAHIARDSLPVVAGHADLLRLCFRHLIDNSLKFHQPDKAPRAALSAHRRDGTWQFAFRDHGIGFKQEQADEIFGIFRQLHSGGAFPGDGIGLAVCKRIVEQAGGRMWAESVLNRGSVLHFTWPVADTVTSMARITQSNEPTDEPT